MQLLQARHLGLLARLRCNRTIYRVNRARGSGPHVGSTISSCAVLQEGSCLRTSSTTCTNNLGIRHDPQCSYLDTTMLRQNQQDLRPISTHATQDGVKQSPENKRVSRPPEVHYLQVKNRRGRDTGWENVKAIFTQQRARNDSHGRACERWLWISFSGSEPTEEELALEWPREKQAYAPRTLWDKMTNHFCPFYDVTEKTGENGRRFWRETFKRTCSGTFEEECRPWEEWMGEETLWRHSREKLAGTLMERDW